MKTYKFHVLWGLLYRRKAVNTLKKLCAEHGLKFTVAEYKYIWYSEYRIIVYGEEENILLLYGWIKSFSPIYTMAKIS